MVKTSWLDIDAQGRRIAKIVKMCETYIDNEMKTDDPDYDMVLAFMDRLIKSSAHQSQLTNMNLKLNMLFKLAEKKYADEIQEMGLKELVSKRKK